MVPQARTEQILRERLRALGGEVEFGKALATFTQNEHGVEATLSTGEMVRANFLVGCDGGHSTVRKVLGLRLEGEAIDEKPMLVADLEIEGLDRRDWHVWPFAKGGMIGALPVAEHFAVPIHLESKDRGSRASRARCTKSRAIASSGSPGVRSTSRRCAWSIATASGACSWQEMRRTCIRRQAAKDSTRACRMPTTWAGSSHSVVRGGPDSLLDTYEAERLPIAAAVLGLSKRLLQNAFDQARRCNRTNSLLHYRNEPPVLGRRARKSASRRSHARRSGWRMAAGSSIICAAVTRQSSSRPEGPRILIRPDGYIAHIGSTHFAEYAGEPTRSISGTLSRLGLQ